MKKWIKKILLLSFAIAMVASCQVDPVLDIEKNGSAYDPTPFEFDLPSYAPVMPKAPADNPLTEEGVELGRKLFYDPITSGDNTMACASCHNQSNGFTDNGKKLSSGILGIEGTRNSMPLFNLAFADEFFWDGRAPSLRRQVIDPIRDHKELNEELPHLLSELNAHELYPDLFYQAFGQKEITEALLAKSLSQFMRSIVSFRSKYDSVRFLNKGFFSDSEQRGYDLFFAETGGDCFHCHTEGNLLFSTLRFENNGLTAADDVSDFPDPGYGSVTGRNEDFGKFKIPSLRNVELTAPYMHDGRFETLKEVLDFYSDSLKDSPTINHANLKQIHIDNGGMQLTEQEKLDIIAFLKTLTDHSFVNDTSYQNPFE